MKKRKTSIGKVLILLCTCLSMGAVANAAGKSSADVEITIEADATKQEQTGTDTKQTGQKDRTVKTGDHMAWFKYAVALSVAATAIVGYIRKKKKGMLAFFALFLTLFVMNGSVQAADVPDNVNVTIPTNISISFGESGEHSISEFGVNNQSAVPITIEKIHVTECNNWRLSSEGQEIPVNTKRMVFAMEGKVLAAGENLVSIPIAEQSNAAMDIQIQRGAWTIASAKENALALEFEYTIGKKEFQLRFDTNGNGESVAVKRICNGDSVELPTLEREGYAFAGWEDEDGTLYTGRFIMPIGDVTLKAVWKEKIAYAIYSVTDTSLRFVRTADSIQVGDTYNGRVVTELFTGFEDAVYTSEYAVPWYDGNYYNNRIITKIIFEDIIKPKSTAHWFQWAYDCTELDVTNLDTSGVTNMAYMLQCFGGHASSLDIVGISDWDVSNVLNMEDMFCGMGFLMSTVRIDLSKWDVSNVTNMYDMFYQMGQFATSFSLGDLSGWDVSNVTDMQAMFMHTGAAATWSLDLSKWNVKNVRYKNCFCISNESKIIQPKWVN